MFNDFFENRSVCEIVWKNIVEPDRPEKTIWSVPTTCRVRKCTNTQSEYIILFAFILQQLLNERSSMLRSTYIAYLGTYYCILLHILTTFHIRLAYYQSVSFNAVNLSYCDKIERFATDISVVRFVALVPLCMVFHCYVIIEQCFLKNKQHPLSQVIAFCCCHYYVDFMFLWLCMPHCFSCFGH